MNIAISVPQFSSFRHFQRKPYPNEKTNLSRVQTPMNPLVIRRWRLLNSNHRPSVWKLPVSLTQTLPLHAIHQQRWFVQERIRSQTKISFYDAPAKLEKECLMLIKKHLNLNINPRNIWKENKISGNIDSYTRYYEHEKYCTFYIVWWSLKAQAKSGLLPFPKTRANYSTTWEKYELQLFSIERLKFSGKRARSIRKML